MEELEKFFKTFKIDYKYNEVARVITIQQPIDVELYIYIKEYCHDYLQIQVNVEGKNDKYYYYGRKESKESSRKSSQLLVRQKTNEDSIYDAVFA